MHEQVRERMHSVSSGIVKK